MTRTEDTDMSDTVHLAIYDGLADWEVGFATAHINSGDWQREPGRFHMVAVGEGPDPVTTMGGLTLVPDMALPDLDPAGSAMLILPGASTWLTGGNGAFVDAARSFLAAGVPVAAICGATGGLAAAGLLDDRPHTSNAREFLEATGYQGSAHYRDEGAVTDGDLITASATAPVDFAREIFARLGLYEPATLAAWYKLYGEGDPAGYFELMASVAE
jgi:putative intracellular protease/amidase